MRIVVVEDNHLVGWGLELTLTGLGHEVCQVTRTAEEALAAIERHHPDLITCDPDLGIGRSGVEVARFAHDRWAIRALFIAGTVDEELKAATESSMPVGYIAKAHIGEALSSETFDEALVRILTQMP